MATAKAPGVADGVAPVPLRAAAARAIDETIAAAALRIERTGAAVRVPLFAAILVRFWAFSDTNALAQALTAIPIAVGIAFSAYVLAAVRRPPRSEALWLVSVSVDALAGFSALLPNALWPAPAQVGVLFMPDSAIILLITVSTGLRLSRAAALWGIALNIACLCALIAVDRAVSGARHAVAFDVVSLCMIYMVGGAALALVLATATRGLARRSALEALRADRAERGLGAVLSDHHDVKSLLTSSLIDAEILVASLRTGATAGDRLASFAQRLLERLRQIGAAVVDINTRALGDLTATMRPEAVDLAAATAFAIDCVAGRHDGVVVRLAEPVGPTFALVAGGEPALGRILVNLLDNACGGDGARRPASVVVAVRSLPDLGLVELTVEDDGPGFAPAVLAGDLHYSPAKPGGLGVGLSVVRGLVEASGGLVRLANRTPRGAAVTVRLPRS